MAVGIGGARSGNLDRADQAEKALAALRDETAKRDNQYWSKQIEVQRREVAAWILEKKGKGDEALSAMRSAADLEDTMDKSSVTPGAVIPARELLAELLLLEHNARQAFVEYETVLKSAPNRFNALYGAAQSAAAFGENTTALEYYKKLTETTAGNERPEIETARQKLAE
jgi:tetratricopeptide (TPR) repeat protein